MAVRINLYGQALALRHAFCRATASSRADAKTRSVGGRLFAFLRSRSEGQYVIESALVLPILLMIFLSIFAAGFYMYNDVLLNTAVGTGAESLAAAGVVSGTNMSNASSYSNGVAPMADPCSYAFSQMTAAAPGLNPANITVTYVLNGSAIGPPLTGSAANTCSSSSAAFTAGGNVTLIATYPCNVGLYSISLPGCPIEAMASQFIYTN